VRYMRRARVLWEDGLVVEEKGSTRCEVAELSFGGCEDVFWYREKFISMLK
jgi:hypothetical protein